MAELNINPTSVDQIIPVAYACYRQFKPLMIWGDVGIGKSSMIYQFGEILEGRTGRKVQVFTINCSCLGDTADIRGLPMPNKETGKTEWFQHELLPEMNGYDDNRICIVFLDELPAAPTYVQIALNEFLLEGSLGSYKLPPDSWVVAAGNRAEHGNICADNSAIADRLVHMYVQCNAGVWLRDVAEPKNFHPYVVTYLERHPDHLHTGDYLDHSAVVLATPRSWEAVSNLLYDNDDPELSYVHVLIMGLVGDKVANTFRKEINQYIKSPSIKYLNELADNVLNAIESEDKQREKESRKKLIKALPLDNYMATVYTNNNLVSYLKTLPSKGTDKEIVLNNIRDCLKAIIIGDCLSNTEEGDEYSASGRDFLPAIVEQCTLGVIKKSLPNSTAHGVLHFVLQGNTQACTIMDNWEETLELVEKFWNHPVVEDYKKSHGKELDKIKELMSQAKNKASLVDSSVEEL
jgi:hypothetical protein